MQKEATVRVSLLLGKFDELPGGPRQGIELAKMADDAGLYSVQLGDHLVFGNRPDRYPYGAFPHSLDYPWFEPISTLSAFAAVTSQVRLSMNVLVAPLRPAILLAKQLATLDVLSDGRCEPGLGIGWQPEEYLAERLDWDARHVLFRDSIAACRALWGEQPVTFSSETVSFENLYAMPRPVQRRLPILCGLRLTKSNIELISELCDGWAVYPGMPLHEIRDGVNRLRESFRRWERDSDALLVRSLFGVVWDDHRRIDLPRTFEAAGSALEAGVNVMAFPFPLIPFGDLFHSMRDVSRFISSIGRLAREY
jgi:probable F420-dependent oxidoreductase